MKEDILEQVVEEYLHSMGYFVMYNVRYRPSQAHPNYSAKQDSVRSDIDLIGLNPNLAGHRQVLVVNCKSWQHGFNAVAELNAIKDKKVRRGRKAWQSFRELCIPKWSEAFLRTVRELTGSEKFTYILAVTKLIGDSEPWLTHKPFQLSLHENPMQFLSLADLIAEIRLRTTTTPAGTDVGRMIQVMEAANLLKSNTRRD